MRSKNRGDGGISRVILHVGNREGCVCEGFMQRVHEGTKPGRIEVVIEVEGGERRSPLMLGDLRESDVLNRMEAKTGKRDERTTMRNVS